MMTSSGIPVRRAISAPVIYPSGIYVPTPAMPIGASPALCVIAFREAQPIRGVLPTVAYAAYRGLIPTQQLHNLLRCIDWSTTPIIVNSHCRGKLKKVRTWMHQHPTPDL